MSSSRQRISQFILLVSLSFTSFQSIGQEHSVAREWIEATLHAVRNDFARPTVHARNLHHVSIAMYDTWALFDDTAETYLLGKSLGNFKSDFTLPSNISPSEKEKILSHAVYRLLTFRFSNSPNQAVTQAYFDSLMVHFGYSLDQTSIAYENGTPEVIGNFIASEIIRFGLMDGSNEQGAYENLYYEPINSSLLLTEDEEISLNDPDRWQPLTFEIFIDQSGNTIPGTTPEFLGPEWGNVFGFALEDTDMTSFSREEYTYKVFHDPLAPPSVKDENNEAYLWGFTLVSHWASHLDTDDGVLWDISPNSIGNVTSYPASLEEYQAFYLPDGGTAQDGYNMNPVTGNPYEEQIVPRGDYARVLAEFWADGPDSETPPGHWFAILNYVMDQPEFEPKYYGSQTFNERLEYDIKAYFTLSGAMHDAAISAWSIKGWYDYIRPISAIRYMCSKGQSSDATLSNYHPHGIPLTSGLVEVVGDDDPLSQDPDNIGKIKLYTWRGHDYIENTETDVSGAGWVLGEDWWPYQRPSFVTPPFAGYISGHSTYSSAAAEVLATITGSPYFPGGLGEFHAGKNEFLVFEDGPSQDVTLQWASYKDAADQCSLSRIWGGIHPPADDIPGRVIGPILAKSVIKKTENYFSGSVVLTSPIREKAFHVFPNPIEGEGELIIETPYLEASFTLYNLKGQTKMVGRLVKGKKVILPDLPAGLYFLKVEDALRSNALVKKLLVY